MPSERVKRAAVLPGWVKGFVIAGAAVAVVVIVMLASGHGPWQHMNMTNMH